MQIKSSCESMCVDFYEIKDVHGKIDTQNRLKVLTFMGETMKKGVINVWKMAEQLDDYLLNLVKKRTLLVDKVLKNKKNKKDIVDKKRIKIILKNINKKSRHKNIDPKITESIWKSMIKAYIDYEFRNFKKK